MTIQEINQMVESIGLPFTYYEFPEGTSQAPPYVAWFIDGNDDFKADNINYCGIGILIIELYTSTKDFVLETQLQEVLKDRGLFYHKEENKIDSENLWQIAYRMEVIVNG